MASEKFQKIGKWDQSFERNCDDLIKFHFPTAFSLESRWELDLNKGNCVSLISELWLRWRGLSLERWRPSGFNINSIAQAAPCCSTRSGPASTFDKHL